MKEKPKTRSHENKKTEKHKKQHLATLKRLKRGDDNELEIKLRMERRRWLLAAVETEEEGRKSKSGE